MKKLLLIVVAVNFCFNTKAQDAALTAALQTAFTDEQMMGMSIIGIRGDSVAYEGYYGLRDFGRSLPINENTLYRIASVSKSFTAAALMKLYEQNLFSLDDDVSPYLGFTLQNPNFPGNKITFRMLMSHTSSIQDGTGYDGFLSATAGTNPPPPLSALLVPGGANYTANMFRSEKPGSYFNYSNVEFGVLATLVERISNTRFDIYVRQNILLPLGIAGSFNIQDITNINDVAVLYRKSGSSWAPQLDNYLGVVPPPRDLSGYVIGSNGLVFSPQGGLRISGKDCAKFMCMIMNNGVYKGTRVLNDSTVRKMREAQWIYTNASSGNNYFGLFRTWGNGIHVTTNAPNGDIVFNSSRPMWGHPGEAYGLISDMYADTLSNTGVVFITNGKFGSYTTCNTAFYCIEEKVFNAVYTWTLAPTGIRDYLLPVDAVTISPNPSHSLIVIQTKLAGTKTYQVTDAIGRVVAQGNFSGTQTIIYPAQWQTGMYQLKIIDNNGRYTVKKIIRN